MQWRMWKSASCHFLPPFLSVSRPQPPCLVLRCRRWKMAGRKAWVFFCESKALRARGRFDISFTCFLRTMFHVAQAAHFTSHQKMVFCKIESGSSVRTAQIAAAASFSVFFGQDKGEGEDVAFSFLWQLQGFLSAVSQRRVVALKHVAARTNPSLNGKKAPSLYP